MVSLYHKTKALMVVMSSKSPLYLVILARTAQDALKLCTHARCVAR